MLNTARWGQSATLLPDGFVLTEGGYSGSASLSSSELYPAPVADAEFIQIYVTVMNIGVYAHSATLLPNGLVLRAGGKSASGDTTNAQLFIPTDMAFTNTGPLNTARDSHTATLLPNNSVLVAGGEDSGTILSSAEQYDPDSGLWTNTMSMQNERAWHTATLLPEWLGACRRRLQLFRRRSFQRGIVHPATGKWTNTGSMNTARMNHTATLLPNGLVFVSGGSNASGYTASAELYLSERRRVDEYRFDNQRQSVAHSDITPEWPGARRRGCDRERCH